MTIQQSIALAKFVSAMANVQSRIYAIRSMQRPLTDGVNAIVLDVNRSPHPDLQRIVDEAIKSKS